MTLGEKVRAARKALGMTQRQLGAGSLSVSFISMLEHNRVQPSLATLRTLAERLGQPLGFLLESAQSPVERAEAEIARGEALLRQHRFTEALEAFSSVAGIVERRSNTPLRVRCELGLGQALAGLRQFELAEPHLRTAAEVAESTTDLSLVGAAANALGFLAFRERRYDQAREIFQAGVDRLRRGSVGGETVGRLLANLGRVYVELGLPAQALEYCRQAAEALQQTVDPSYRGLLYFNMGIACERQQSFEQARWYLERAAELFAVHENLHLLSLVKRSLGILYLETGALSDARGALDQSLRLARQTEDDEGIAQTLVEMARLKVIEGEPGPAREAAEEAAQLAARIADTAEAARAHAVLAAAFNQEGRLNEAAAGYETAIATFERLGMTDDLARAYRDLGFVLMAKGDTAAAASQFARAFQLQRQPANTPRGEAPL